jgi:putative thioredoxin
MEPRPAQPAAAVTTLDRFGTVVAVDVTDATFYIEVLERSHELPVVVDFWAEWCAPCRMLAPVLEDAVAQRDGQVALAKIDVDANPEVARHYGIRSIPAVKAFKDGRVVAEFVGAQSPQSVARFLDDLSGPSSLERLVEELRERGDEPELLEALERGEIEQALDALLAQARGADRDRRERVRELMVRLFQELGQDDPLATRYRRELATALY